MIKKIIKTIALLIVLFFGGAVALLSVQFGGIRAFVVQSASMEPTIITGSLAIVQSTQPNTLQPNDIITFIRPDKNREFITHRIIEKFDNQGAIVFKTKGDNNENIDAWQLAGGGVVGKVLFSIPYLGYLLSLARTKIGIAVLILIPAAFIIVDEILNIVRLIKGAKRKKQENTPHIAASILLTGILTGFPVYTAYALMSDMTYLVGNTFTVQITPTPAPCGGNTTITISGNGTGSSSSITITENCIQNTMQTNTSDMTTTVENTASTGDNTASDNTGSSTTITSGDAEAMTVIENTGNTNQ